MEGRKTQRDALWESRVEVEISAKCSDMNVLLRQPCRCWADHTTAALEESFLKMQLNAFVLHMYILFSVLYLCSSFLFYNKNELCKIRLVSQKKKKKKFSTYILQRKMDVKL